MDNLQETGEIRLMMIAAATGKNGRKQLILGLHQENIDNLLNDMPIHKRLDTEPQDVPGLEEWDIYILGPEDLERFMATFGEVNET